MKKISSKTLFFRTIAVIFLISALFFYTYFWIVVYPKHQQKNTYYDQKCQSFEVQNFNLSKGQIVFIGDSITDLYPLDSYYSDLPLAVYNRGIGGDTTSGVLNRMKISLFDIAPSKIVLMIGINDINGGVDIETVAKNYKEILKQIKENLPNTQVFCNAKILEFVNIDLAERNALIKSFNVTVQNFATEYGYTYLDLFNLVSDENNNLKDEYTIDFGHLSEAGFVVWTNLIKPYLV